MSRDDAVKFLRYYIDHEILPYDPFHGSTRRGWAN